MSSNFNSSVITASTRLSRRDAKAQYHMSGHVARSLISLSQIVPSLGVVTAREYKNKEVLVNRSEM